MPKRKKARSPLRYPGGKSRAIKKIMPHIPMSFTEYREPFVGGGSVFCALKTKSYDDLFLSPECMVINDVYEDLVHFWTVARDDIEAFVAGVTDLRDAYQGRGRDLYEYLKSDTYDLSTPLQVAVRFFIMNRITFSGVMDAGGYSQQAFDKRFTVSSIRRLRALSPHLQGVTITCEDYDYWLQQPGDDVFIFCDPPYHGVKSSRLYGKKGELHTGFDHERFADAMRRCPHRWLITLDNTDYVRDLFSFAHIEGWELQYGMNNYKQDSAAMGKEVFIKNY